MVMMELRTDEGISAVDLAGVTLREKLRLLRSWKSMLRKKPQSGFTLSLGTVWRSTETGEGLLDTLAMSSSVKRKWLDLSLTSGPRMDTTGPFPVSAILKPNGIRVIFASTTPFFAFSRLMITVMIPAVV